MKSINRGPRETLERKLKEHYDDILTLSSMVEQSILQSVQSLQKQDIQLAKQIYNFDETINGKRYSIEHAALTTVATQQPMASDLRKLSSVIDIAGELERIGDYAKGIARIALRLGKNPLLKDLNIISGMAEITADMLHRAITAFLALDESAARALAGEDDRVDMLYNQLYDQLLEIMLQDREAIDQATYYLWVAHNLERSADRVTNICERIVFTVSGELIEFDRSDDEAEPF
jgi:phosphate transport system protein